MPLDGGEFIRRFLIHVLQRGFHRIRHYGLLASGNRAETIARARELLGLAAPVAEETVEIDPAAAQPLPRPCPCSAAPLFPTHPFNARSPPPPRAHPPAIHLPPAPSLEAFGRRPPCKPNRRDGPSSETLHNRRHRRLGLI